MQKLIDLFQQIYPGETATITSLKGDGSERKIYRLRSEKRSVIGIIGNNPAENKAFLSFSRHFRSCGLRVPEIYAEDLAHGVYLEEDLGDDTLFLWMAKLRGQHDFSAPMIEMYQKVLQQLPYFQIRAGAGIDYSLCYQHHEFGWASMVWDVHYFRNRFLTVFYEQEYDINELERDFINLIDYLITEDKHYFLYRDFQSRNVMIRDNEPHFIDYQSGRRGALQYDVASLLYDAKANIPEPVREELLEYYLDELARHIPVDRQKFKDYFYGFAYIRIMQAFGAYGFLGVTKDKPQFLKSIPYAIRNLEVLSAKETCIRKLPTLKQVFENLIQNRKLREF